MEQEFSVNNPLGEESGVEAYDMWRDEQLINE